jgi:hypothetical protein
MTRRALWPLSLPILAVTLLAGCLPQHYMHKAKPFPATAKAMTAERRAENVASFERVWAAVNENHYDPAFGGVDWNAVYGEFKPKIQAAATDDDVRVLLIEMLGRLKLSHFAVAGNGPATSAAAADYFGFVPPLAKDAKQQTVTFAKLPPVPLRHVYKRLPQNVGYFYLSIFLNPPAVMPAFRDGVDDARTADGFILDLRHNPGGIGVMAVGMGNAFVTQPDQKLGTIVQRGGELNFVLNPQADPYTRPLAVLIDEHSGSTSEILAGGLQDIGRARVFGVRSAGQALPSLIETLPNGDRFQFAVANYISAGGKPLEGRGVTPDEVVSYDPKTDREDRVVEAALKWIASQKK